MQVLRAIRTSNNKVIDSVDGQKQILFLKIKIVKNWPKSSWIAISLILILKITRLSNLTLKVLEANNNKIVGNINKVAKIIKIIFKSKKPNYFIKLSKFSQCFNQILIKIANLSIFIFRISFLIESLENFPIAVIVKDNKIESNNSSGKLVKQIEF